jgi:hypothetical protein
MIAKKSGKPSKTAKKVTPSKSKSVKPAKSKALKSKKKKKAKLEEEEDKLRKKSKKVKPVEENDDDDEILDDSDDDTDEIESDDDDIDNSAADDTDGEEESDVDLDSLDAGPSAESVSFGCNCASCKHFVKWDDKLRDSAEWLEKMERTKKRCPKLFGPEEYESDNPQDLVAQADDPACAKFDLNEKKAPSHFIETLDTVKSTFNISEFDVLVLLADKLRAAKTLERSMGYKFGQIVMIPIDGKDVKARVVDFVKKKGREVILRGELNGRSVKVSIPAVHAVEIEE